MQNSHNKYLTSVLQLKLMPGCICCMILVLFLFSCSSIPLIQRSMGRENNELPLRYSMVFIIHGDGDYLYHNSQGTALRADEEALIKATLVAVQNPQAEVFIFHEKPRKHALIFFPLRDGRFYYYKHGRLLAEESYWRDQGSSRFDPEVELYLRFVAGDEPQPMRLFLYFGHEIPEFDGGGYDASYSDWNFTIHDFANGLKRFTRDSSKVDLLVLSTCFNGTPHTIATLAPYVRTIVASPDNLHLSYFDLQPLERLDVGLQDGNVVAFSRKFAQQSFDRLTKDLQTAVSVAVYDVDRVQGYLHDVDSAYDYALTTLEGQLGLVEHCDCAEDSSYVLPGISNGVDVFYRPPRFGRFKHKQSHSGWECWKQLK